MKHHPPAHHVDFRAEYLTRVKNLADARCMKIKRQTKISRSKNAKLQECVSLAGLQDLDWQILAKEKIQILHVKGFQSNNKLKFT